MVLRGSSEAAGVAPCRASTERGRAEATSLKAAPFSRGCVFTQAVTWGLSVWLRGLFVVLFKIKRTLGTNDTQNHFLDES